MNTYLEKLNKLTGGFGRKAFNSYILKETQKYQKMYGFDIGQGKHATWNNEADAFKHAYMQWILDYYFDSETAKNLGDMHENETPNAPAGERNMDLWNNAIGREISYEMKSGDKILNLVSVKDIAARKIVEKMRAGELITSPDDPRQFENMELEQLKENERIHYKGEYGKFNEPISDEILDKYLEQAIDNNWIIPDKSSLDERVLSGELIFVKEYEKSDGTKISGYYRRKPTR